MPDLKLCTDNAAMIASAGYYNYISGKKDELNLNAVPNLKLQIYTQQNGVDLNQNKKFTNFSQLLDFGKNLLYSIKYRR